MWWKFRGTVFIQTISAATAQKREQQKQQHQRVSAVWSPDGVFMMSVPAVILFRSFSTNLQFHFCSAFIPIRPYLKLQKYQHYQNITAAISLDSRYDLSIKCVFIYFKLNTTPFLFLCWLVVPFPLLLYCNVFPACIKYQQR